MKTNETATVSNDTWQPALFPGEVQPRESDRESDNLPRGDRAKEKEYARARKRKQRQKETNPRLIEAFVVQTGFYSFYKSSHVYVNSDSHIWDSPAYGRHYNQEAIRWIFAGYVPTLWEVFILMVVGVSNQEKKRATLPLINYLTSTEGLRLREIRAIVGKTRNEPYERDNG